MWCDMTRSDMFCFVLCYVMVWCDLVCILAGRRQQSSPCPKTHIYCSHIRTIIHIISLWLLCNFSPYSEWMLCGQTCWIEWTIELYIFHILGTYPWYYLLTFEACGNSNFDAKNGFKSQTILFTRPDQWPCFCLIQYISRYIRSDNVWNRIRLCPESEFWWSSNFGSGLTRFIRSNFDAAFGTSWESSFRAQTFKLFVASV